MAHYAKVESLDALKELRTFLCSLAAKVTQSLDEADYDVQNTLSWLKNDRYPYWKNRQAKYREDLVKAKLELKRKQSLELPRDIGEKSFIDEKKLIALTQRRFEYAESQLKKVHNWIPELEKQMYECRTALQGLAVLIEHDLPKRRTQIDQMIYSLESYMELRAPEIKTPAGMGVPDSGEDMSKPVEQREDKLSESVLDIYTRLRNRNPFNSMTDELCPGESEFKIFDIENDPAMEGIDKYTNNNRETEVNVTVVVDESIQPSDFLYAEKVVIAKDSKVNVYIKPVETSNSARYLTYTMSDFLKWNPSWLPIFLLPAGWITLFKEKWILSIFDVEERLIYELQEDLH
ncbi:MAG: hypothetical protein ACYSUT_03240 [Planctomycetota bacterium]|jgi:hypothetical protein